MPLDRQQQVLTWASAFLLGISLGRWLGSWRERRKDRLHGLVARSSQLTAAWRAVESLELEGKLFTDDLAASMAGQDAFATALAAAKVRRGDREGPPHASPPPPPPPSPLFLCTPLRHALSLMSRPFRPAR